MANSITIKNENSGIQATIYVRQNVKEIVLAVLQTNQAIKYQQQACIVCHPKLGTFLCIQEGAGGIYHQINTKIGCAKYDVNGPETKAMTDFFRYTSKPIKKP